MTSLKSSAQTETGAFRPRSLHQANSLKGITLSGGAVRSSLGGGWYMR